MNPNNANEPTTPPPADDTTPASPAPETPDVEPATEPTPEVAPVSETPAATEGTTTTPVDAPTEAPTGPAAPAAAETQTPAFFSQSTDEATTNPDTAPAVGAVSTNQLPPSKPTNSNKLIRIIAIVAGVALLAVIAVIAFLALTTVSKEDYAAAATQYNDVSRANSELSSDVSSLSYSISDESDEDFQKDLAAVEGSLTTLKTENEELGKLKAVRVGEGAKVYGAFNDKLKAYLTNANNIVESVKSVRPALLNCATVSDAEDAAGRVASLKECATALNEVKNLPSAPFKTFIDTIKTEYADYATVYEKISALSNPYGAQYEEYKTLRDQMYDIQDKISNASSTFSKDLQKIDDEVSVKETADALRTFLREQQS